MDTNIKYRIIMHPSIIDMRTPTFDIVVHIFSDLIDSSSVKALAWRVTKDLLTPDCVERHGTYDTQGDIVVTDRFNGLITHAEMKGLSLILREHFNKEFNYYKQ